MNLIYQDQKVSCYTDKIIRGSGVVEIQLIKNELAIFNLDDTLYEKITFKKDSVDLENNLKEIVARKVILAMDFLSLEFDCEKFEEEDEFVYIYLNGKLLKIKKAVFVINYFEWLDYVKGGYVRILSNNLLLIQTEYGKKVAYNSADGIFMVKEIKDDKLFLKSTSTGCCTTAEDLEGIVKWREGNELLVDICVID